MEIIKTESRLYFLKPKDENIKNDLKAVILPAVILLFVFGCQSQFLLKM